MNVLIIGGGGREHALAWRLSVSPSVGEVLTAPGNPGIAQAADLLPLAVDDLPALAEAASDLRIDLTVVGPELPLALGIGANAAIFSVLDAVVLSPLRFPEPERLIRIYEADSQSSAAGIGYHTVPDFLDFS